MPRGSIRCEPSCSAPSPSSPPDCCSSSCSRPPRWPTRRSPLSGEGSYGIADDKVVTNHFFAVILFFPLFVLFMSLIQWRLEKRKEQRKAISKRLTADRRWQSGW